MLRSISRLALVAAIASTTSLATAQQPGAQVPAQSPTQRPTAPVQSAQDPAGRPAGQAQAGRGQDGQMAQGVSLNAFIAHKLKRGNEAEVELGQLASERARTDSVKQFAQMMVKEHQQMIQQLEQFDQGVGNPRRSADGKSTNVQPGLRNPNDNPAADRAGDQPNKDLQERARNQDNTRNSDSNTDGQNRDQPRTATQDPNTAVNPGTAPITQLQGGLNDNRVQGNMSGNVPQQLVALTDQTCDIELQMTRQMLEKHEGGDFEMAYIGQQIVAHTCMLAHLQALKNSGPQELQQLVTKGEQSTRQHLEQAQKIAMSLASHGEKGDSQKDKQDKNDKNDKNDK